MKLLHEQLDISAKEVEHRAKEEVVRHETMVQRQARNKMLEYTKEIVILKDKLDEKNNLKNVMEENREKLKLNWKFVSG